MSLGPLTRKSDAALSHQTPKSGGLRIGEPNDAFEHEADRVADEILAPGRSKYNWSFSRIAVDTPIPRNASGSAESGYAAPIVRQVLRSSGEPLGRPARDFFEPRFGYDFGRVRIHTDAKAAESARSINALAYTVGDNIVFGSGQHNPRATQGQRLLAHELAHVMQQSTEAHFAVGALRRVPLSLQRSSNDDRRSGATGRVASPVCVQRQTGGGGQTAGGDQARLTEDLLRYLSRNDGAGVVGASSALAQSLDDAKRTELVNDLGFRAKLRAAGPAPVVFSVLRRLFWPLGAPSVVEQLGDALYSRDSRRALAILRQSPQLRDPKQFPGVYEAVETTFRGTPEYADLMKAVSWDVSQVLAIGGQSRTFNALKSLAEREARQSGEQLTIEKGTEPGVTESLQNYNVIVLQPDVKSPEDAVIRLSHELANKAARPEFAAVNDRRNRGEFKTPTQYAEAILAVEADSVIERAKVAVELNIQENPTVEAWVRDMRANKISANEVHNRVLADVKARYKGPGGISAMETYESQFREWDQRMHPKQVTP